MRGGGGGGGLFACGFCPREASVLVTFVQGAFAPVPNKFGNNKIHNIIKSFFAMVISSIPAAFALRKVISSIPAAFALKTAEIPSTKMIYFYMNMNLACNDFQLW